jgi:hypothetical protein
MACFQRYICLKLYDREQLIGSKLSNTRLVVVHNILMVGERHR